MVEEFTNVQQEKLSVDEYSLKIFMLARYSPSLVSNPRDEMIHFYERQGRHSEGGMLNGEAT